MINLLGLLNCLVVLYNPSAQRIRKSLVDFLKKLWQLVICLALLDRLVKFFVKLFLAYFLLYILVKLIRINSFVHGERFVEDVDIYWFLSNEENLIIVLRCFDLNFIINFFQFFGVRVNVFWGLVEHRSRHSLGFL